MVLNSLFSKDITVGIDIGSNSMKAVEIEPTAKGWELVNAAVKPTPIDSIKDGVVVDVSSVSIDLRAMLKEAGIKANGSICAVSGSQVIVRQVQFPKMTEAALRKSIRFEAGKFISASVDDSVIEFEILGAAAEPGQMNVMLVAAPREMVDSRVAVLESSGIEPLAIDIEAFALIRALVEFNASDEYLHRTVALIDMGAGHTDVNIVSRGEFALRRDIPIAGDSFTNAIKSLTGGSFEEAEKLKLQVAQDGLLDQPPAQEGDDRTWKVVQPLLDELMREVKRSIHFYQQQIPDESSEALVSKVLLTGGSARIPGIDAYVSAKLGISAEVANVFKTTAVNTSRIPEPFLQEHGGVLAVGTGLALKELVPEARQEAA